MSDTKEILDIYHHISAARPLWCRLLPPPVKDIVFVDSNEGRDYWPGTRQLPKRSVHSAYSALEN